MPIYDFTCVNCETKQEALRSIDKRFDGPFCPKCGNRMIFTLSPPPKPTDHLYPYIHEHIGKEIRSLKHLRQVQKAEGIEDAGKPRGVKGQWI
jgi:putative FmdB family regulatory protein